MLEGLSTANALLCALRTLKTEALEDRETGVLGRIAETKKPLPSLGGKTPALR